LRREAVLDKPAGVTRLLGAAMFGALLSYVAFSLGSWQGRKEQIGRFQLHKTGDSSFVTIDTVTGALHYSTPTYAGDEQGWVQTNRTELHVPWLADPRVTKTAPFQATAVVPARYSTEDSFSRAASPREHLHRSR
jgi:hypothetical protein